MLCDWPTWLLLPFSKRGINRQRSPWHFSVEASGWAHLGRTRAEYKLTQRSMTEHRRSFDLNSSVISKVLLFVVINSKPRNGCSSRIKEPEGIDHGVVFGRKGSKPPASVCYCFIVLLRPIRSETCRAPVVTKPGPPNTPPPQVNTKLPFIFSLHSDWGNRSNSVW